MANNSAKQRLFEVMGKVDSSFKQKLNEWGDENPPDYDNNPRNFEPMQQSEPDLTPHRMDDHPLWNKEQPVDEMSNWGVKKANPKYSHFAVLKNVNPAVDGKIVNGWEYRDYDPAELRQFKKDYFFQDIIDNQINPKLVNIVTAKHLQKQGIDPYDYNNWYKNDKDGFIDQIFTM